MSQINVLMNEYENWMTEIDLYAIQIIAMFANNNQ